MISSDHHRRPDTSRIPPSEWDTLVRWKTAGVFVAVERPTRWATPALIVFGVGVLVGLGIG